MRHHAFAAAMGLVTAAILAPGSSSQAATADPTGYWYKPDAERESKIQVFKCGKSQLCAKIVWLKDPNDSRGKPLHDIRNENPSMHDRPIVGLTLFSGMAQSAPGTWSGQIYNPEDGHTYAATLTMLSRSEIKLRGCKAWLLCGEKQWLRTSAPPAAAPATAPEGTQQIEASATPAKPAPAAAAVAAATPAPAPKAEVAAVTPSMEAATDQAAAMTAAPAPTMAAADPAPQAEEAASSQPTAEPVALVSPAPQSGAGNVQKGYGFLNASATSDTAAQYSGENVTSMFKMTSPVATGAAPAPSAAAPAPAQETAAASPAPAAAPAHPAAIEASAGGSPVPLPDQKPKAKTHVATVKSTAKASSEAATGEQGAPVPQDGAMAQADVDPQSAEVDTAVAEPLTRRQRRLLRRQQEQQEPFLPWLR
jgi:uncharacterized protein (DUF2147 family)